MYESRWGAPRTDKNLSLTIDDIGAFLLPLRRYRYLSTDQFLQLNPKLSKSWIHRRLNHLRKVTPGNKQYIARPKQQELRKNKNYYPIIYELTKNGERALVEHSINEQRVVSYGENCQHFWHTVAEAKFLLDLTMALPQPLKLVPWWGVLEGSPKATREDKKSPFRIVVKWSEDPKKVQAYKYDNIFYIDNPETNQSRAFALEVDMNTEPLKVIKDKLKKDREIRHHKKFEKRFDIPRYVTLFLTTHPLHMQGMRSLIEPSEAQNYVFKLIDEPVLDGLPLPK